MKNKILLLALVAVSAGFFSCSKTDSEDSDYVSVRIEDSKMWSLLDVGSGKIVMTDEFFAPSTSVVKGSFFVENDNGEFDLYNLKDTKNRLNRSSFSIVTNFNPDGFAIARVKDEPWQIIDTEGKIIATLDKTLNVMSGFSKEGLAMIKNKDDMIGYVNTLGETPIKPRYKVGTIFSDGIAFVLTKQEDNHNYFSAIDPAGNTLFTFSDAKYSDISLFNQGHMFAVEGDHSVLLDKTGKKLMTVCKGTNIANLSYHDGKIIYYDGQYYGVKNTDDKILIRAKYQRLKFQSDGNLLAVNNSDKFGVITSDDEIVVPFDYDVLEYLAPSRYLTMSGSVIVMIDNKGKEICDKAFSDFSNRSNTASEVGLASLITATNNEKNIKLSDAAKALAEYYMNLMNLDEWNSETEEEPEVTAAAAMPESPGVLPTSGSLDQFAYLSTSPLSPEFLQGLSKKELRILRNAIFARHGYMFQSEDLQHYFGNFYDYVPTTRNVTDFNKTESANVAMIQQYE